MTRTQPAKRKCCRAACASDAVIDGISRAFDSSKTSLRSPKASTEVVYRVTPYPHRLTVSTV